jgi:hypothetical protein
MLLDPAAEVLGLGVAHHLSRIADRLQIARDDFVKRRSFGPAISHTGRAARGFSELAPAALA